ncbi:PREDICTED: mucin-like protein [Amphimedon queenslandica]|uniref:Mucin-like protein n=1 Tax=Amphimedon queenslandica TaxID=400682 RepID=A0AAN0IBD1_AMPQE|nr:PREDICTED: mucin-like protein [Amphimedon queenslandica]|eukprot:XP_003384557.1 PREDICTED: mucin-like protein [Amphimedon queenslandica]
MDSRSPLLQLILVALQLSLQVACQSGSGSSSGFESGSGDDTTTEGITDYLPFQDLGTTTGIDRQCLKRRLDGASPAINIPVGFPIGTSIQSKAYVGTNGIISFDEPFLYWYPSPFPTRWGSVKRRYVVAPYWSDNDIRDEGDVCYEVHNEDSNLMRSISEFISYKSGSAFRGNWMLLAEWSDVHPYPHGSLHWWWWSYYGNIRSFTQNENTYQAVVITDGVTSYSLFTYNCEELQWSGRWRGATIGYNSGGRFYRNDKLSGLKQAKQIGCRNEPMSPYNNVIYQLSVSADVIQQLRKRCYDMHREDIKLHKDIHDIYNSLEPCPCTWWQGWRDRRFTFQWQAWYDGSLCHQQRFPRNKAAQFCCYSLNWPGWGSLKTAQSTSDWGTNMLRYHPGRDYLKFLKYDHEFRRTCCSVGLCSLYYERRPTNNCARYRPPRRTWGWGDPHITTLDNFQYTFNGLGEFILLELNDGSFTIQGRAIPVNSEVKATKFSSLAFKENISESVEIKYNDNDFTVYVDKIDMSDMLSNVNETYNNNDSSIELTRQDTDSMLVAFANGISVTVNITMELLHFTIALPEDYINQTRGLLGNYNGIKDDDLEEYNGTAYENATKLNESAIYDVANTWRVKDNSSSLFVSPAPNPDPSFKPTFVDLSSVNETVVEACENDTACVIDATLTNNISIGLGTLNVNSVNVVEMNELSNFPPTMTGDANITVFNNVPVTYNFHVSDTGAVTVAVSGSEPSTGSLNDLGNGDWEYTFTWTIDNPTSFSLSFVATDAFNASATLVPLVSICGCINDGNCTYDGVVDATNTTIVLPCECPEDVWEGQYCEIDVDGCEFTLCFDDVECSDNPAPMAGASCGPCPQGFSGDGTKCNDVDECVNGTNLCEQRCVNTEGSYHCECWDGYRRINDSHCEDINECAGYNDCHQFCNNTIGSYFCSCREGFHLETDNETCAANVNCPPSTVIPRGVYCAWINNAIVFYCGKGYTYNSSRSECQDTNECLLNGACEQICNNTIGSFSCSCREGFTVSGRQCNDIDECLENALSNEPPLCSDTQMCTNTIGDYECVCPEGTEVISLEECVSFSQTPTQTTPPTVQTPTIVEPLLNLIELIAIAVGGGVALALLVMLMIVCAMLVRKKKNKKSKRVRVMPARDPNTVELREQYRNRQTF